jgi:1-acyl-sn-glycerol-3-phosphate acyltransferase
MLYEILKPLTLGVARLGFRLTARGTEHVPMVGAALFVSNHSSFLDSPLVGAASPRTLHFMAKAELFGIPLFGPLIRALNARPVRREGADAGALRAALRVLQEEHALLVFPEGTRGPEGMLREARPGAGMLAVLSEASVVPVYIEGSGRAWPKGRRLPRPARVTVTFGKPLHFARTGAGGAQSGAGGAQTGAGGRKEYYAAAGREMMAAIAALIDDSHQTRRTRSNG